MAFSLGSVFIEVGARNDGLRRDFAQTQKIMNGFKSSVLSFAGPLTAALSLSALGANAVSTITNFEQAVADLGSIAGKSRDQMAKLTESAIKIGSISSFTATQVVQLQTELAKLGFNETEILSSTKAIGDFSVAVGTDAASAAALGGAALRSFGIDASKADSVMNTLAIATTKSALDFSKLQTALPYVGTAANQMGISLEKTTAILGLLSDRGVRAETAGTSLRDILLDSAKSGLTFEESLARVANSQDKLKTATDIFGKTSAGAAVIIAENSTQLNRLQASITNVDGALKTMTDQRLDTAKGKLELMTSAWEGFILSVDKGDGVFSRFAKSALSTMTDLIDDLQTINDKGFEGLQEKGRKSLAASVKQDKLNKLGAATGQRSIRGSGYGKSFQDELKGATQVLDSLKEQLSNTNVESAEFKQLQADIAFSQARVNDLTGKYTGIIDNNTKSTNKSNTATGATIKQLPTLEQQISAAKERIKQLSIAYQTNPSNSLLKNINSEISKLQEKEGILAASEAMIQRLSGVPPTFVIKGSLDFPIDDIRTDVAKKLAEIDASVQLGLETEDASAKISVWRDGIKAVFAQTGDITDPLIKDFQSKINAIQPPTFKVIKGGLFDFENADIFDDLKKKLATIDLKASVGLDIDVRGEKIGAINSALSQIVEDGNVTADVMSKINAELTKIGANPGIGTMSNSVSGLLKSFEAASSIIGPLDQLFTQFYNNQSAALDEKTNKQIESIELTSALERDTIEKSLLGEDEKSKRLKAIEEDKAKKLKSVEEKAAKERAAIARKTAIQNKILGIFNATVSMFEGVAKALSLGPAGLPLVPIVKALGLANIAAIASAPLPSLAIGTNYVKSDGLAKLHKGESVVPARVTGHYTQGARMPQQNDNSVIIRNGDLKIMTDYSIHLDKRLRGVA